MHSLSMKMENFKLLTLNCWGVFIPCCTVRKNDRLEKLMERLSDGSYDIIMLQEIWTDNDFRKLRSHLGSIYKYSNYFHSKLIGGGICIFSKWPMDSIFMHSYGANGHPYLLHQCDWYCGKGVGLARVISPKGFRINLYVTHLIARYALDRNRDRLDSHRLSQLMELVQFVRMSSASADAIIVAGDFNLEPDTAAIRFFRLALGVSDAWLDNVSAKAQNVPVEKLEIEGCTCDRADNPYRNDAWTRFYGNGERLDYIFYRTGNDPFARELGPPAPVEITCHSSWLDFQAVPDDPSGLHYSDHEGVGASFSLVQPTSFDGTTISKAVDTSVMEPLLLEMQERLLRGLRLCRKIRQFQLSISVFVICLALALLTRLPHPNLAVNLVGMVIFGLIGATLAALVWGSTVGRTTERRSLENAVQTINVWLSLLHSSESKGVDPLITETVSHGDVL